ncbi:MAG: DinB family protein [Planctomycetota bacterium]
MAEHDPITILLAQNQWATHALLDACADLSDDDFHRVFPIGMGSLHDTVNHILGAMQGWGDLLAGRDQRERLESQRRSVAECRTLLDALNNDLAKSAQAHPNDEVVTGSRGDQTYAFTRGAVLTHVLTHGMHHRAQCLNMLRQLDVKQLPPSAVVEWTFMADAPATL